MTKWVTEELNVLDWPPDDVRWVALLHFVSRVEDAGINLVSNPDRVRVVKRHLQPSLEGLDWIPECGELLDVGSGGGFPAIPIALAKPRLIVTMVEASSRKSAFLRRVSRETNLTNVQVLQDRVEMLGPPCHGYFDLITARAVADVRDLIKWTRKFLAPGGRWLLWKGRDWQKEGNLARLKVQLVDERVLSDGGRLLWLEPKPAETKPT